MANPTNRLAHLMRQGMESAEWRGHTMGPWVALAQTRAESTCRRCGWHVMADSDPPANGIDLGGRALALNCGDLEAV